MAACSLVAIVLAGVAHGQTTTWDCIKDGKEIHATFPKTLEFTINAGAETVGFDDPEPDDRLGLTRTSTGWEIYDIRKSSYGIELTWRFNTSTGVLTVAGRDEQWKCATR